MGAAPETRGQREEREAREDFEGRIAKALGHRYRVRIMELLSEEDGAPVDIARVMEIDPAKLSYHFKVLLELDCIELVELVPVRGTVKHVYRSKQPAMFADLAWAALSPDVRSQISKTVMANVLRRIGDAMDTGTFDQKDDRHLSLETVSVDWEGWDEIRILMEETLMRVAEIEKRAVARTPDQDRFPTTAFLLSFESPKMYELRDHEM